MYTLGELAKLVQAELVGDADCKIERVATLSSARDGDITFLTNTRFKKLLATTQASAVIVSEQDRPELKSNGLVTDNPHLTYAKVATLLYPATLDETGIHPSSVVDPSSKIAASAWIGPNCSVGKNVSIGKNSYIGPGTVIDDGAEVGDDCRFTGNVTICHGVRIGDRVIIHPGAVIGSDGFGLANDSGRWFKVPQVGTVIIGNDVEIGANCAIDRGAIEDTILEEGVKLDNLVHIAHNVQIGAHSAIAGGVGIAGSTKIGKHFQVGGLAGIAGHIEIADNVLVTGMTMVTHSIREAGAYSSGMPVQTNKEWQRNAVRLKQLDKMARQLKELEQQINQQKK